MLYNFNIMYIKLNSVLTICWSWKCKVKIFYVDFGYFEHNDNSNILIIPLKPRIIEALLYVCLKNTLSMPPKAEGCSFCAVCLVHLDLFLLIRCTKYDEILLMYSSWQSANTLFVYFFPKRQILHSSKLKEFADDNFKYDENSRKFSKRVENTV